MKIAFYKGRNRRFVDKSICFLTNSEYSHCELVLSEGFCLSASARDGGVRMKHMILDDRWDVYEINKEIDIETVLYWYKLHDGDAYDWLGAIGALFRVDWSSEDKKYCSQAVSTVMGMNEIYTPGRLFTTMRDSGMINV